MSIVQPLSLLRISNWFFQLPGWSWMNSLITRHRFPTWLFRLKFWQDLCKCYQQIALFTTSGNFKNGIFILSRTHRLMTTRHRCQREDDYMKNSRFGPRSASPSLTLFFTDCSQSPSTNGTCGLWLISCNRIAENKILIRLNRLWKSSPQLRSKSSECKNIQYSRAQDLERSFFINNNFVRILT